MAGSEVRGVDDLLADARARIDRLERREGIVPGSLHVPRTVLEWRADPGSGWSNPHLAHRDRRLVLLCTHGHSSSLAAAVLLDLGFEAVADVVGGFEAWRVAGLPVRPAPVGDGEFAGMADPD